MNLKNNAFARQVSNQTPKRKSRRRRLYLESLEPRIVFAASPCAGYQSYDSIKTELDTLVNRYPGYASIESIGRSVGGKDLWVMNISDNVASSEADEPAVFYSGGVHGNEPDGARLSMDFIKELLASSAVPNSNIKSIVDKTDIYIMPVANPDGYAACSRTNKTGVNLNRSFTDYSDDATQSQNQLTVELNTSSIESSAPEAAALMRFSKAHNFVLTADLHANGGTAVVNYPYDLTAGVPSGSDAKSPDDALFKYISKVYSSRDSQMWDAKTGSSQLGTAYLVNGKKVSSLTVNTTFPQGITNGSDWFAAAGTFQDWQYRYMGTNAVTVELRGVANYGTSDELFLANRNSMFAYLQTAHVGVTGKVTDATSGRPVFASVTVEAVEAVSTPTVSVGKHFVFTNTDDGQFVRMLPPAIYNLTITVSAPGYNDFTQTKTGIAIGATITSTVPPSTSIAATPTLVGLGTYSLIPKTINATRVASGPSAAPLIASAVTSGTTSTAQLPSAMQETKTKSSAVKADNRSIDPNSTLYAQAVDSVFAESDLTSVDRKTPTLRAGVSPLKLGLLSAI